MHGWPVSVIYWSMEKIIYLYTVKEEENKKGIWRRMQNVLGLSYPVREKNGVFAGCPLEAYAITSPCTEGRRFRRTLRKIKKRIQRREMQRVARTSQSAFLFCQWEDCVFPAELLVNFYRQCQEENVFVFRAEQLIFIDGWERPEGEEESRSIAWDGNNGEEMTFMSEIYSTYNYVTIVTQRWEAWRGFVETAYEEYGLSVRCVADSARLTFRDKATLIIDLYHGGPDCYRCFPGNSVYMDLRESSGKQRIISAKCGEIPYISLRNSLDTTLKDTV